MTLHCSHSTVPTLQGSQPPLYGASGYGRVHIVRRLIQRGADVNLAVNVSFSVIVMLSSIVYACDISPCILRIAIVEHW